MLSSKKVQAKKPLLQTRLMQMPGAKLLDHWSCFAVCRIDTIHQPTQRTGYQSVQSPVLFGLFQPLYQPAMISEWAAKGFTVFSIDMLPRTTRAQSMDVLSSQANIAGYKAVCLQQPICMQGICPCSWRQQERWLLQNADTGEPVLPVFRPLQPPGDWALVEVFDTRPAVKEEVMSLEPNSLKWKELLQQQEPEGMPWSNQKHSCRNKKAKIAESVAKADIVITTAQIPGKSARSHYYEMIETMRAGSVIVDIAAATGKHFAHKNNETVVHNAVSIIGNSNLPTTMPGDASKLYGKNILNFCSWSWTRKETCTWILEMTW